MLGDPSDRARALPRGAASGPSRPRDGSERPPDTLPSGDGPRRARRQAYIEPSVIATRRPGAASSAARAGCRQRDCDHRRRWRLVRTSRPQRAVRQARLRPLMATAGQARAVASSSTAGLGLARAIRWASILVTLATVCVRWRLGQASPSAPTRWRRRRTTEPGDVPADDGVGGPRPGRSRLRGTAADAPGWRRSALAALAEAARRRCAVGGALQVAENDCGPALSKTPTRDDDDAAG